MRGLDPLTVRPTNPDTDRSTYDTVQLMLSYSDAAQSQQPVIRATQQALAGLTINTPAWRKCQAIHSWVTKNIRFVTDEEQLQQMGYPEDWELLIAPYVLLRHKKGDCDDFAMLTRAMLLCAGVPAVIETIAADPKNPRRWSHVYVIAQQEDGSPLPVDTAAAAQHPRFGLGWQAPNPFRSQEWVS